VERSCEHGIEPWGSVKCWEVLERLSNCWLFRKDNSFIPSVSLLVPGTGHIHETQGAIPHSMHCRFVLLTFSGTYFMVIPAVNISCASCETPVNHSRTDVCIRWPRDGEPGASCTHRSSIASCDTCRSSSRGHSDAVSS
jgi:hypothetical protein